MAGNLHRTLRSATLVSENCTAANTWQLAVSLDEGAYANVGSAVIANGHQVIRPVTASAPSAGINFHTLKPRLTQVAANSSAPPQIRGPLTIIYDERPDTVTDIQVVVLLGQQGRQTETSADALLALADHGQSQPITIRLPGQIANVNQYAHVSDVEIEDRTGDGVLMATVSLTMWETS